MGAPSFREDIIERRIENMSGEEDGLKMLAKACRRKNRKHPDLFPEVKDASTEAHTVLYALYDIWRKESSRKHFRTLEKLPVSVRVKAIFLLYKIFNTRERRNNRSADAPFETALHFGGETRHMRYHHAGDAVRDVCRVLRIASVAVARGELTVLVYFRFRKDDSPKYYCRANVDHNCDYGLRPFISRFNANCRGSLIGMKRSTRPVLEGYHLMKPN